MTVITQIDATRTKNPDEQIALALRNLATDAAILRLKIQALR